MCGLILLSYLTYVNSVRIQHTTTVYRQPARILFFCLLNAPVFTVCNHVPRRPTWCILHLHNYFWNTIFFLIGLLSTLHPKWKEKSNLMNKYREKQFECLHMPTISAFLSQANRESVNNNCFDHAAESGYYWTICGSSAKAGNWSMVSKVRVVTEATTLYHNWG